MVNLGLSWKDLNYFVLAISPLRVLFVFMFKSAKFNLTKIVIFVCRLRLLKLIYSLLQLKYSLFTPGLLLYCTKQNALCGVHATDTRTAPVASIHFILECKIHKRLFQRCFVRLWHFLCTQKHHLCFTNIMQYRKCPREPLLKGRVFIYILNICGSQVCLTSRVCWSGQLAVVGCDMISWQYGQTWEKARTRGHSQRKCLARKLVTNNFFEFLSPPPKTKFGENYKNSKLVKIAWNGDKIWRKWFLAPPPPRISKVGK